MLRFLAALLVVFFAAGSALADDSALNKEGRWIVGRGDAGAKGCMASIHVGETAMLLIQVAPSHIDFVVATKKPMRAGKHGVLTVGDQRFEFRPDYFDKRDMMFFEDVGGRAFAAVRQARWISAVVDGRELMSVDIQDTGVEGALDAVVACSEGKSGWWGPGVGQTAAVAQSPKAEVRVHKDGIWQIEAPANAPGVCLAAANATDGYTFTIFAEAGALAFGVGSDTDMRKGRKGRLTTDAFSFDFKPTYDNANFFYSEDLDSQAAFALRRAKAVAIRIDGKPLIDMDFEGTGYAEVLDDLAACAAGETGWWGEGAKQP